MMILSFNIFDLNIGSWLRQQEIIPWLLTLIPLPRYTGVLRTY